MEWSKWHTKWSHCILYINQNAGFRVLSIRFNMLIVAMIVLFLPLYTQLHALWHNKPTSLRNKYVVEKWKAIDSILTLNGIENEIEIIFWISFFFWFIGSLLLLLLLLLSRKKAKTIVHETERIMTNNLTSIN